MRPMPRAALLLSLALACRLEEHVPSGRLRDEAEIRIVLAKYFEGRSKADAAVCAATVWPGARLSVGSVAQGRDRTPGVVPLDALRDCASGTLPFGPLARDTRMLRADLRVERDLGLAWVAILSRQAQPVAVDLESNEVIAFSRIQGKWLISGVTITSGDGR
jgi:hypothetical protein